MRKIFLIAFCSILMMSCSKTEQKSTQSATTQSDTQIVDESIVNVYYFHGKKRCKTCVAVGDLAKTTIGSSYAGNNKVRFTDIDTEDKTYEALVEKYEISWNALIIAKGSQMKDITDDAFALALDNPEKLKSDIKSVVNSMLENK